MIKAINSVQKRAGDINYTSVKFSYDGRKVPPPFVGNYFFISIRDAVNPAPVIIQFKSHIHFI